MTEPVPARMHKVGAVFGLMAVGGALAFLVGADPQPAGPGVVSRLAAETGVELEPWLPGPAVGLVRSAEQLALESQCRRCHPTHAQQWASSQHATSWTGAAFQRAFAFEPLPFCRGCHAPEASPPDRVTATAADAGVGCVTCHLDPASPADAPVVWTSSRAASGGPPAPHAVHRSPSFSGTQVCAGCHEFGFPDSAWRDEPLLMQSTLSEHGASEARARTCNDCHMPERDGHRDHGFAGAYDPQMLAKSLRVDVTRVSATSVRVRLLPGDVGHAVPTGDLLRRLEVALEVDDGGRSRTLARRWLGRRFEPRTQADGLTVLDEIADERVGPAGRWVELRLPRGVDPGVPLRWRVTHQRVAHGSGAPRTAPIEGQIDVATGPVDPWPGPGA